MKKSPESLTINGLTSATGIDRRTIRKRLAEVGMLTGRSGWTMAEALPFILAGKPSSKMESARLRLITAQTAKTEAEAAVADAKLQILLKNWCPLEGAMRILDNTLFTLRCKVSESDMPQQLKIDVLADLKAALAAEYFDEPRFIEEGGPLQKVLPSPEE